jgi:hypothetical protein
VQCLRHVLGVKGCLRPTPDSESHWPALNIAQIALVQHVFGSVVAHAHVLISMPSGALPAHFALHLDLPAACLSESGAHCLRAAVVLSHWSVSTDGR